MREITYVDLKNKGWKDTTNVYYVEPDKTNRLSSGYFFRIDHVTACTKFISCASTLAHLGWKNKSINMKQLKNQDIKIYELDDTDIDRFIALEEVQ